MKINNNLYLVFWDILFLFVVYVRVVNVCLWKDIFGTPVNLQGILGKFLFEGPFRFMDQFDQTWTMWRAMGRWVTTIVKESGKMQEEVLFLSFSGDDGHWGTNWHLKKHQGLRDTKQINIGLKISSNTFKNFQIVFPNDRKHLGRMGVPRECQCFLAMLKIC